MIKENNISKLAPVLQLLQTVRWFFNRANLLTHIA